MSANNQTYYALILPQLQSAYKTMSLYGSIFLLVPGWCLNLLMTFVFASRKRFWTQTTMGFYYTFSSIMSNLIVIIGLINFFPVAFGRDLTLTSVEACRAIWYFRLFVYLSGSYFQVQISIDRALNVLYPRRFIWLTKPRNLAKIAGGIVAIFALNATIHLHRYFVYSAVKDSNRTVVTGCILSNQLLIGFNLSNFIIRVIELSAKFVCSVLIIYKLRRTKRRVSTDNARTSGMTRKEIAFAVSLTTGNLIQLTLILPFLSVLIVQLTYAFNSASAGFVAFGNQLYAITNWGNFAYEALQFPIVLATNRIFRSELFGLFKRERRTESFGSFVAPTGQNLVYRHSAPRE